MSWQLSAFTGLALVVGGGIWWYESRRPPARLVALVAALAALAVAGRIVLAPVPNVVATTDIALITGYALGAAPGFAVGALAAPISNIWLGQGPWTVWQMGGWGLAGLAGAWLALATRRRTGRLALAVACALAGFVYGALLDLYTMVGYGGEQSLDRYLALSARAIPFNVAHAAGNFAIALAAGPALVRMISRYRTRTEFSWRPAGVMPLAAMLAALALTGAGTLAHPPPAKARASSSAGWLAASQDDDGGFAASPGQPSSPSMTGWAMLGLEAAGRNPLDVTSNGSSAVSYLRANAERLKSVGDLERTILALSAAGVDPRSFAGRDLVAALRGKRDRDGSVDGQVNLTAFFVLALRAAGSDAAELARPVGWLRRAQERNGGWGFRPGAPSDPDSTGAALQALVAGNGGGDSIDDGVLYLRRAQTRSGGFALSTSGVVNSQSTAWAVQGLVAAGANGKPLDRALAYLRARRAADGHYRYSASSDQTPGWVTSQVLLAVNRAPLPLPEVGREARPGGNGGNRDAPPPIGGGPSAGVPAFGGSGDAAGALERTLGRRGHGERSRARGKGAEEEDRQRRQQESERAEGVERRERENADAGRESAPESAATAPRGGDDDADAAPYVAGGLAGLALALGAGFFWYRSRLP